MVDRRTFDVVVIGAGPAGENVADRAVRGGLSAVVVEEALVGGDCSYWACMPSKALLRPTQLLHDARQVGGAREVVADRPDLAAVLARRDAFTSHWDDGGQVRWLDGAGIALVRGHGRLAGERQVAVDTDDGTLLLIATHAVVLATGSAGTVPPIDGLRDARPWTTHEATSATAVPARLAVLGGGVAGCELAQAFARLGSRVTLLEATDRLLAGVEPFAGQAVAAALGADGVDVRTGVTVSSVRRGPDGLRLELDRGGLHADELLVAAGRRPRTGDLGLESVGLQPGSWVDVDDTLCATGVAGAWLYAVGDLNHRALLTHQGKYQARACGDAIVARSAGRLDTTPWTRHVATADHRAVPQVVFTDPEVAAVGLGLAAAEAAGVRARAVDYDLGAVAGAALHADGYAGTARMVVDEDRGVPVGFTFVGPGVAELLHSATVAVVGEVPIERLWHAVPSYPTISEVWLRLLEAYGR